jgi:hypothetical protein
MVLILKLKKALPTLSNFIKNQIRSDCPLSEDRYEIGAVHFQQSG